MPRKKVLKMSTTMGMASAFALSALLLSPLALAEESQSFAARNAARVASAEHSQVEMSAKDQYGNPGNTPPSRDSPTAAKTAEPSLDIHPALYLRLNVLKPPKRRLFLFIAQAVTMTGLDLRRPSAAISRRHGKRNRPNADQNDVFHMQKPRTSVA
ncbi:hypothetical protein QNM99_00140 [Pseudomonas sp. PCH446]